MRIYRFIIFILIVSIAGCDEPNIEINNSENLVKFIGEPEELQGISFVELQNENLLILADRVTEKDITLNPFDNPDVGFEDKDYVLIETNKFGNQISKMDAPYSAQQIELKENQGDILLLGLANEAFFFIYDWEDKKTLYIIEFPRELFSEINANSTIKFYPQYEKILFNYFKWNADNETEDQNLVILDYNGSVQELTFPRELVIEEVLMHWIWDPGSGRCRGAASATDCQSSQPWREFIEVEHEGVK